MKRLLVFFLALTVMGMAQALAADKLAVATDTNFPPFEFKDPQSGAHTGFDVEL